MAASTSGKLNAKKPLPKEGRPHTAQNLTSGWRKSHVYFPPLVEVQI